MTPPDLPRPPSARPFSSSDAAFEGFRLLRTQPGVVLAWSAIALIFSLGGGLLTVATVGPQMARLIQLQALGQAAPPAEIFGAMASLAPFYAVTMVAALALYAVLSAAVNRAVLRPLEGGFGRLRLGRDELLQAAALALIWLILFLAYIVIAIAATILGVVVGVAMAAAGAKALAAVGVVVVVLLVFLTLFYLMVRLSLLSPLTFDTGRVDLGAAWRMTRGRVLPLFGAYLLAALMGTVVMLIFMVVFAVFAVTFGGGLSAAGVMMHPDMSSVQAYFRPVQIVYLLLVSLISGLFYAVFLGAPAQAYAQLAGADATVAAPTPLERGF